MEARVSSLSHFIRSLRLKIISARPIHLSVRKVNCGQLCLNSWIWRWERVRDTSFMSKQVSFDISKIKNEENKVRWKLSKNRK
jgi:hypothetical protein